MNVADPHDLAPDSELIHRPPFLRRMRHRTLVASLSILFLASVSEAAQPSVRKSFEELVAAPLVHQVPGQERVQIHRNLSYSSLNNPHLLMDVYIPPELAAGVRVPAVFFIHGGAGAEAHAKDWGYYQSWGTTLAASGVATVTFNHRLGYPAPELLNSLADINAAISYVRSHAGKFQIDPDRLALAAVSAGGPMLAPFMRDKPSYIRAFAAFNVFLDIQHTGLHILHEPVDRVREFSPITHLDSNASALPPLFIVRGGEDEIPGINESIDRFMAKAIPANVNITFINHPTGDHTFITQKDDRRSRETIRAAIVFLKTHLEETESPQP
jgi:acetyl esterase/lipase